MRGTHEANHAATTLADVLLTSGSHQIESAPHGDIDGATESGHISFKKPFAVTVSGIADGDIESSEGGDGVGHEFLDGSLLGDIGLEGECGSPGRLNFPDHFGGLFGMRPIVHDDFGTGVGESEGGGPANS
jgi:hypothetical protein